MGFFDRWKKAPKSSADSTPQTKPSKPPGAAQPVSHRVRAVADDEIFEAVKKRRFDDAVRLLSESGKINLCDAKGISILKYAVVMEGQAVVRFLLSKGADPNTDSPSALHNAFSDRTIAKLLIDHGARVDARDNKGQAPLMWAAGNDKPDVVELLLDAGADPNAADSESTTSLHHAALRGAVDSARLLISRGASVEAVTQPMRMTPLHCAARGAHPEIGTLLIHVHANVHGRTAKGNTPLIECAEHAISLYLNPSTAHTHRRYRMMELLIEAGSDVNAKNDDHKTALNYVGTDPDVDSLLRRHGGAVGA